MGKWRDLAAQARAADGSCANSAISANSIDPVSNAGPFGTNGTNGTDGLPAPIVSGLATLRTMAAPNMKNPEVWPVIVADSLRLASSGWAERALNLGWEPLQLWGCSPAIGGMADLEGLALWLDGRRIALLDSASCMVQSGPRSNSIFNRRGSDGAVLIWNIGRRA